MSHTVWTTLEGDVAGEMPPAGWPASRDGLLDKPLLAQQRQTLGYPAGAGQFPLDKFECPRCGRLADVHATSEELRTSAALMKDLEMFASGPMRPAQLTYWHKLSHEDAVRLVNRGEGLGLLTGSTEGYTVSRPVPCSECLRAMRAAVEEGGIRRNPLRDPIPAQLRFRVLQRDAFRCMYCGRTAPMGAVLHVDHVVPVAIGGDTSEDNLITACDECNLGKSATAVLPQ
jgi:hypothetical protein